MGPCFTSSVFHGRPRLCSFCGGPPADTTLCLAIGVLPDSGDVPLDDELFEDDLLSDADSRSTDSEELDMV